MPVVSNGVQSQVSCRFLCRFGCIQLGQNLIKGERGFTGRENMFVIINTVTSNDSIGLGKVY
jgi:hypothetical protein